MGASKFNNVLNITGETPEATLTAHMHYLVGFGLSRWHIVEQDLTMCFLMLVCPKDSPVDGALASYMQIQTTDGKITHLIKVLTQVLYQDEIEKFRTWAKRTLNRIRTLNDIRNDIAHGWVKLGEQGPRFQPFYNVAHDFRVQAIGSEGNVPSTIVKPESWDLRQLQDKIEALKEGTDKSGDLMNRLTAVLQDERTTLERAVRMTLDLGIPFDPRPPETPQPSDK